MWDSICHMYVCVCVSALHLILIRFRFSMLVMLPGLYTYVYVPKLIEVAHNLWKVE